MKLTAILVSMFALAACDAGARQPARQGGRRYHGEIAAAIASARSIYPVPPALVRAVIQQESGFNARALSRAGARGLMQVMPANAPRLGVTPNDLWDPAKNVRAGVRLLAMLLKQYDGDVVSALVAYNARPRAKFAPIPRNGETPAYVWKVLAAYERYRCEEGQAVRQVCTWRCVIFDWRRSSNSTGDRRCPHSIKYRSSATSGESRLSSKPRREHA